MKAIYKGLIISPKSKKTLNVLNPGYLVVSEKGEIEEVTRVNPSKKYKHYPLKDYSDDLICPGFVDVHNHLSQYEFAGLGGAELLTWLKKYTFPHERKFKKDSVARSSAKVFFNDLIKNGTTTVATYVTIHKKAVDIAFKEAKKSGLRTFIGKVMMDQNSPEYLTENIDNSLRDSEELIEKWNGKEGRLFYILSPRFALSCSFELLRRVAELARRKNVHVQTHLAENMDELKAIKEFFPKYRSYTEVYEKAGLLGEKSIMAHCIYLSDSEIKVLKKTGTKIAHCPTSNRFLKSGIMPFRKYFDSGIDIGLGTDVAGGYSLSMFNEMKEAVENSKYADLYCDVAPPMTLPEAFYAATLGGAKVLSMDKEIGSLEKGKKADFLIIDYLKYKKSNFLKPRQILSKLIYRGDASVVQKVFVQGKQVRPVL
jgi:guanine deaminase